MPSRRIWLPTAIDWIKTDGRAYTLNTIVKNDGIVKAAVLVFGHSRLVWGAGKKSAPAEGESVFVTIGILQGFAYRVIEDDSVHDSGRRFAVSDVAGRNPCYIDVGDAFGDAEDLVGNHGVGLPLLMEPSHPQWLQTPFRM